MNIRNLRVKAIVTDDSGRSGSIAIIYNVLRRIFVVLQIR